MLKILNWEYKNIGTQAPSLFVITIHYKESQVSQSKQLMFLNKNRKSKRK